MLRLTANLFSFAKSSQYSINNIFNAQPIASFTSPSDEQMTHILHEAKAQQQKWRQLPSQQKQTHILKFIDQFKNGQALSQAASLLSASTGKQILECESELKTALRVFNYQLGYLYPKNKPFGRTSYRFEPFDCITSIFDHRHPFIAAFAYFAVALRSNNSLFLRPSPSVLPAISYVTSLWSESTSSRIVRCLPDLQTDPKHKESLVANILNETEGFISFWGRLKEGLNFHYYMSQSNQSFLENQFMLTSSDSAYVMKDLSTQQLRQAASQVARGSFSNCGHNFNSIKRVFVDREVSSQFQHLLLKEAQNYTISDSIQSDFSKVALNDGKLAPYLLTTEFEESRRLLEQIRDKHSKEISVLQGGEPVVLKAEQRQLHFITPAILRVQADFPTFNYQDMECMMPICFLSVVDSPQSCVEKINSSIFGTTATLFSNSLERAEVLGEKLEVGTVNLNTWELEEGIPYSGRKRSGKGFSLSPLSFNNIVRSKSLSFP